MRNNTEVALEEARVCGWDEVVQGRRRGQAVIRDAPSSDVHAHSGNCQSRLLGSGAGTPGGRVDTGFKVEMTRGGESDGVEGREMGGVRT